MKIGILTLHSQINYGGVLQAWAMQKALEEQGHDAIILDRRDYDFEDDINLVRDGGIKLWFKAIVRMALGLGAWERYLRARRTLKFINENLKLSSYHFSSWQDVPNVLGVDELSVGSDQVWNSYNCRDGFYLLEGAPKIPAVSYAACFGMKEIPADQIDMYRIGLKRFYKIGVREQEAVEICKELGFNAIHECDPTLLVSKGAWNQLLDKSKTHVSNIVCYFVSINIMDVWDEIVEFAEGNKIYIRILVNSCALPFGKILPWLNWHFRRRSKYVCLMAAAGPKEFVQTFYEASAVVSDSFHALMFSYIFDKAVRNIRPTTKNRQGMFGRITEFISSGKHNRARVVDSLKEGLEETKIYVL